MTVKSRVLSRLEQNRGNSISGEQLATDLHVSRAAVWKAINELKKEGYRIDAATNRGYCLEPENDRLSSEGIGVFLNSPELQKKIFVYPSLDSTNQCAKKLAMDGAENGTTVFAEEQTAGKGRMGRQFFSPSGSGLYMSMILRPKMMAVDALRITTAASVIVCEALERIFGVEPQIKWVNDIYLHDRKIAGILTEAITDFESGAIDCIVVGIGLNIYTPEKGFPEELKNIAGAVYGKRDEETPSSITRNRLAAEILQGFNDLSTYIECGQYLSAYKKRSWVLGEPIEVFENEQSYRALAKDIDDRGGLVIEKEDGTQCTLRSGEIRVRRCL